MRRFLLVFAAMLALVVPLPAAASGPAGYYVDEAKLPFAGLPGLPSERTWGVLDGAGYRMEVPSNWNGSLVLWAHGYRGTGLELTVDNHPLRAYLLTQGFAWAASSYATNGYDAGQGARDTRALTALFSDQFGVPQKTYATGASMGGHVTALLAETWPQTYDGALSVCGALGNYELFDYHLDFNVAAQTLSGVGAQFPFSADYLSTTVPATKAALGPAFPYALNAQGQALAALTELRSGGERPLFDQGWLYWNGVAGDFLFGLGASDGTLPRQPGVAVQNSDAIYQFDTDATLSPAESAFNAGVQRITADRQARRTAGLAGLAPTTGDLRVPMLTLHTLGDLFVPFGMEQEYARLVASHGSSNLLVQRATRDIGHCSFAPSELVTGFSDLVAWVTSGIKPEGDDVLDPATVAAPDFGCAFTDRAAPRLWDQSPALAFLRPPACRTT